MRRQFPVVAMVVSMVPWLGDPAGATVRHAFLTSFSGTGNLSTWPGDPANGLTGIAAANRICRNAALASSFSAVSGNADAFRAWISTASTDAYCNVLGLSGEAPSCGQGEPPPPNIGPWTFANGASRFALSLGDLLDGSPEIWVGMFRNEDFVSHDLNASFYWTGTGKDGRANGLNCQNWTSGSPDVDGRMGDGNATSVLWTDIGYDLPCSFEKPLLCLESGAGEHQPWLWFGPGALAFVTSKTYTAILGDDAEAGGESGVEAAHAICRARAAAGRLPQPETFVALISDGDPPYMPALLSWNGQYRRIDGTSVAADNDDLFDGVANATLHQTELGTYIDDVIDVWTGTSYNGAASGHDCSDWDTLNALGTMGSAAKFRNGEWAFALNPNCTGRVGRLFCFGTEVVIFWDGFEYGPLERWSDVVSPP